MYRSAIRPGPSMHTRPAGDMIKTASVHITTRIHTTHSALCTPESLPFISNISSSVESEDESELGLVGASLGERRPGGEEGAVRIREDERSSAVLACAEGLRYRHRSTTMHSVSQI